MPGEPRPLTGLRVAIAYDCLFPWTVGGAERWYRSLAEGLVAAGCRVTYLTRQQWPPGEGPDIPGVAVVAVSPAEDLYDARGGRRLGPTLRYGAGLTRHLAGHRRSYDIVHTANFPFWSVLGARAALAGVAVPLVVDWHEVWGLGFWREYAGGAAGSVGWAVQRACIAASQVPVVTSPLNAARLAGAGGRRPPLVLPGYFPSEPAPPAPSAARQPPYVLFAGRHIRDKGVDLVPGVARALAGTGIEVVVAGDGPMRAQVEADLGGAPTTPVEVVGFVAPEQLEGLMAGASALVVPSRREGYGMVVVEAARLGTPSVVAAHPENLAAAHIVAGRNGLVAPPDAASLGRAIREVVGAGDPLRRSTLTWASERAQTATVDASVAAVVGLYRSITGSLRASQ